MEEEEGAPASLLDQLPRIVMPGEDVTAAAAEVAGPLRVGAFPAASGSNRHPPAGAFGENRRNFSIYSTSVAGAGLEQRGETLVVDRPGVLRFRRPNKLWVDIDTKTVRMHAPLPTGRACAG